MSNNRETSFDGYVSNADGGRGMFKGYRRPYVEAPDYIRRCHDCNDWKRRNGIKGNFWCKHNKFMKIDWDQSQRRN